MSIKRSKRKSLLFGKRPKPKPNKINFVLLTSLALLSFSKWNPFMTVLLYSISDLFCENKAINWVYNNLINYYTDFTNPIPESALETSKQISLVRKS